MIKLVAPSLEPKSGKRDVRLRSAMKLLRAVERGVSEKLPGGLRIMYTHKEFKAAKPAPCTAGRG